MASVKSSFDEVKAAYQKMRTNLPIVEKAEALCFWQVAGSRRRIPVVTSDATAPLSLSRPDGKKSGTYLSGAWTRAELPKDTGADLRFIDRGAGVAGDTWYAEQGLQEIASESCPDAFLMLGRESGEDDSKPADGSVPKGFYEALQVLKEKTEGDVLVSLRGLIYRSGWFFNSGVQASVKSVSWAICSS